MAGLCVVVGACGGVQKTAPTRQDMGTVSASLADIVYQCQSVAAGFIASPDNAALRTDVDRLLGVYRRVKPDAPVVVGNASGLTVHTTVRKELAVAAGNLQDGCFPAQARRIAAAAGGQ